LSLKIVEAITLENKPTLAPGLDNMAFLKEEPLFLGIGERFVFGLKREKKKKKKKKKKAANKRRSHEKRSMTRCKEMRCMYEHYYRG
jgi:hypothetical protein